MAASRVPGYIVRTLLDDKYVRTVNGVKPNAKGELLLSDLGVDDQFLVLDQGDPVPADTPAGTIVAYRGAPYIGQDGTDGRGITSVAVNQTGRLIVTFTDNTTADAGYVVGAKGADGAAGAAGVKGDQGIQGIQGLKGDTGTAGAAGTAGAKGDQGIQGIQGLKGDTGTAGAKGDQGIQGIQGVKGDQGIQGIQGVKGDTGATGATGPAGTAGSAGAAVASASSGASAASLRAWSAALVNKSARLLVVGDSKSEGQGATALANRWIDKAADQLLPTIVRGVGYLPVNFATVGESQQTYTGAAGTAWTAWRDYTGSFDLALNSKLSFGRRSARGLAGATITFTVDGTNLDIWHINEATGSYTLKVDSAAAVSQSVTNAGTLQRVRWNLGGAGLHTVVMTFATAVHVAGFEVFKNNETAGIRLVDGSHYGFKSSDFTGMGTTHALAAPDLFVLALGLNDPGAGLTPAQSVANMKTIISEYRAAGGTGSVAFVVTPTYPGGGVGVGPSSTDWSAYVAAYRQMGVDDPSIAILNFFDIGASGANYASDNSHPNNVGHLALGTRFASDVSAFLPLNTALNSTTIATTNTTTAVAFNVEVGTYRVDQFLAATLVNTASKVVTLELTTTTAALSSSAFEVVVSNNTATASVAYVTFSTGQAVNSTTTPLSFTTTTAASYTFRATGTITVTTPGSLRLRIRSNSADVTLLAGGSIELTKLSAYALAPSIPFAGWSGSNVTPTITGNVARVVIPGASSYYDTNYQNLFQVATFPVGKQISMNVRYNTRHSVDTGMGFYDPTNNLLRHMSPAAAGFRFVRGTGLNYNSVDAANQVVSTADLANYLTFTLARVSTSAYSAKVTRLDGTLLANIPTTELGTADPSSFGLYRLQSGSAEPIDLMDPPILGPIT